MFEHSLGQGSKGRRSLRARCATRALISMVRLANAALALLPLRPLLLAHVCALALTLSVLSHSYARLSFRRLARWLIARSTVVERRTYYLYYDDVQTVNPLGQFLELDARA